MADKNSSDLERQITEMLQAALDTGEFSQLKNSITSSVNTAVDTIVAAGKTVDSIFKSPIGGTPPTHHPFNVPPIKPKIKPFTPPNMPPLPPNLQKNTLVQTPRQPTNKYLTKANFKKGTGIALSGLGGASTLAFGITSLALMIPAFLSGFSNIAIMVTLIVFSSLTAASVMLALSGNKIKTRWMRYRKYWDLLKDKKYFEIKELARNVNKKPKWVIKELRKFIDVNMLPEAYISRDNTYIMIGKDTYQHYLEATESAKQRDQQKKIEQSAPAKIESEPAPTPIEPSTVDSIISQRKKYVGLISQANTLLHGAEITQKLTRMEEVVSRIFQSVEQKPHKLPHIRKFMDYYLPTAMKIVMAYQQFDAESVQGDNILNSKKEMLEILDTLNASFETLLDKLYHEDVMDISTDISALKTILAQEGLTERDFLK